MEIVDGARVSGRAACACINLALMNYVRSGAMLLALTISSAHAGSLSAAYANWDFRVSGDASDADSQVDFDHDLGVEPRNKATYALSWDTGPGYWPDLAVAYTPIEAGGQRAVSNSGGLLDPLLGAGGTTTIVADADLEDLQLSLSYPLRRGAWTLALGATVERLHGQILLKDESDAEGEREPVDETFPMAHLGLKAELASWLSLEAGGDYVSYRSDRAYDYHLQAAFIWGPAKLGAGWLVKAYRVNNSSYLLDTRLSGPTLGFGFLLR